MHALSDIVFWCGRVGKRVSRWLLLNMTFTCSANNAKTIRQNIVSVITSANCLNECNSALIIVLSPVINIRIAQNVYMNKLMSRFEKRLESVAETCAVIDVNAIVCETPRTI